MAAAVPEVSRLPQYPRLLRRVRAALIDSVVFVLLFFAWQLSLDLLDEDAHAALKLAPFLLGLLLAEPGLVAWTGGTIGHHAMGLRIRDAHDDRNIGLVRATLRAVLRTLLGWFSLVFILITRRHQAIHDYVSRSVVVLRQPSLLPESERVAERAPAPDGFEMPSGWRRAGVIVLYTVLSFVLVSIAGALLMSDPCLYYDQCTPFEDVTATVIGLGWFAAVAAVLVLGWRGQLFGCRRQPIRSAAEPDAT